jgi:hypothetical protein
MSTSTKRFNVALSFPGEHRGFVEKVAFYLTASFGPKRVLYDRDFEAEFARADFDIYLQRLYHDESELIAVFLCADYERKEWCGLEWRALRDLIKRRQVGTVMFLRFDSTDIPGLFSTDGYAWVGDRGPEAIAALIIERYRFQVSVRTSAASPATAATERLSTPLQYDPPLVVSILTAGRWQKSLADTLALHSIKHRSCSFGNYGLFSFVPRNSRQGMINEFYDFYGELLMERRLGINRADYRSRPSVIADSFSTYIVGSAMQKFADVQFDKVILCASILPVAFDWSTLFHRDQVNFVRNEYGSRDIWTSIVGSFIEETGASGTEGFQLMSSVVSQEQFERFKHSDYFHEQHIERHWLPVLRKEPSPLLVRHGRNMDDGVYQFESALDDTGALDDLCFADLKAFREIPDGRAAEWIGVEPDIYTFLFNRRTGRACGYINAMPVTDECFGRIINGLIDDPDIEDKDVVAFLPNATLKMYLMSVAIDPELHRTVQGLVQEPLERLVNGFVGKLYYYAAHHGIQVTKLAAVGWTTPGCKLCEAFGMVQIGQDQNGRPIYWLDFRSANLARSIFPSVRRLAETYKRMAASQRPIT